MLERMLPMTVEVRRILDVGAATGKSSRQLARRFRRSRVVSLDASMNMLRRARRGRSRFARVTELQADALALPLPSGSMDLVFANLLLPWIDDLPAFFSGVARVLRKDGLFVFSTLGPDSFAELREAWRTVDEGEHVSRFPDMHDVGDAAVRAGLRDPVLDVDWLTLEYGSTDTLLRDLTAAGARNSLHGRGSGLSGRGRLQALRRALPEPFSLRLELVFGHAFGGAPRGPAGEYRLDVSDIGRRRRQGGGA